MPTTRLVYNSRSPATARRNTLCFGRRRPISWPSFDRTKRAMPPAPKTPPPSKNRGRGTASDSVAAASSVGSASERVGAHASFGLASDASDLPSGWGKHDDEADRYDWGASGHKQDNGKEAGSAKARRRSASKELTVHTDRIASAISYGARAMSSQASSSKRSPSDSLVMNKHEASQRWPGFPLSELKGAGYHATQLRAVQHTAADLKSAGFTLDELKAAGFSAEDLKNAHFRAVELKSVGFSAQLLKEAGFKAVDLKNAGFRPQQLKDVGYTAGKLKSAGFTAADLKEARYKAADLREAGYSVMELKQAGFTARDLREAGYPAGEPITVGFSFAELKAGGYPTTELLRAAGYSAAELMTLRYTLADLIQGGFGADDLVPLGVPLAELTLVGYQPKAADLDAYSLKVEVKCKLTTTTTEGTGRFFSSKLTTVKLNLSLAQIPSEEPDLERILFA